MALQQASEGDKAGYYGTKKGIMQIFSPLSLCLFSTFEVHVS